jgi:hypothetical protein
MELHSCPQRSRVSGIIYSSNHSILKGEVLECASLPLCGGGIAGVGLPYREWDACKRGWEIVSVAVGPMGGQP